MQLADARVSERPLFSERDRWFESAFLQQRVRCELDFLTATTAGGPPVSGRSGRQADPLFRSEAAAQWRSAANAV